MIKGKIVLVSFPFDDLSTTKVRPAVCLIEPVGIYRHVLVAFITSQMPAPLLDSDLVLDPSRPDFAATGLRGASVLRLHRLVTVPTSLFKREIGMLFPAIQADVAAKLRRLLEL